MCEHKHGLHDLFFQKTHRKNIKVKTDQFVLLQVESLQFAASFRQSHHALVCDTVALTQVDVLQLTTVLSKLKCNKKQTNK